MELNDAWIALIGTLFGGLGLRSLEAWLNRNRTKEEAATKLRGELRDEVYKLREELRQADQDLDRWRTDYFDLKEKFIAAKAELNEALRIIKSQANHAEERLERVNNDEELNS